MSKKKKTRSEIGLGAEISRESKLELHRLTEKTAQYLHWKT